MRGKLVIRDPTGGRPSPIISAVPLRFFGRPLHKFYSCLGRNTIGQQRLRTFSGNIFADREHCIIPTLTRSDQSYQAVNVKWCVKDWEESLSITRNGDCIPRSNNHE